MMLRRAAALLVVGTIVALAACGGSPKHAPPNAPAAPTSAVSVSSVASDLGPPVRPAPARKTVADHHREFMTSCATKRASPPDYCECAWGEVRKAFTDDELSAGDMPQARVDKVKGQVLGACASKIPEENVRDDFARSCVGAKPELKPYCDCTWTELRRRFSPAELNDEPTVTSDRFLAARVPVAKACGSKMPESVSKGAFMSGCMKDPSVDEFCDCVWKELRKRASPSEIEAGSFDQKTIFGPVEKTCGKLRPATVPRARP